PGGGRILPADRPLEGPGPLARAAVDGRGQGAERRLIGQRDGEVDLPHDRGIGRRGGGRNREQPEERQETEREEAAPQSHSRTSFMLIVSRFTERVLVPRAPLSLPGVDAAPG